MARILSHEEIPLELRNSLLKTLRPADECILLPQSHRSVESGGYKNAVFTLEGSQNDVPASVFSGDWCVGISAVLLDDRDVEPLLRDPEKKARLLRKLSEEISSETASTETCVGPALDCDAADCDKDTDWVAGFDGPTCLVGLYCAEHSRAPEAALRGQNRVHRESYLVCRAGAGVAAATFHARLMSSLRKGRSLDDALLGGVEPGPQALRRVQTAGTRNRAAILLRASEILGFKHTSSLGDQASRSKRRGAVMDIDVNSNTLKQVGDNWIYSTAIDCATSQGLITSSNVSDGFVVFSSRHGGRLVVRNDASSSIPFSTERIKASRDLASDIMKQYAEARNTGEHAHVDIDFIRERFAWKSRDFGEGSAEIVPFCLHGSHREEYFVNMFSRELGLVDTSIVRLRPELVVLSGVEASKLRPLVKSLARQ